MPIFFARVVAAKRANGDKAVVVNHDVEVGKHNALTFKTQPVLRLTNQSTVFIGVFSKSLVPSTFR